MFEVLTQPPLAESEAVRQSLEALRKAKSAKGLSGWRRLAEVQNHLVDLLHYLEAKEGFSLFPGQRQKCASPNHSLPEGAAEEPTALPATEPG